MRPPDDLTVISEQDVLGDRLIRAPKRKRRAENFLTETQSLTPGDLVVHVDHGIGRYQGHGGDHRRRGRA